MGIEHKYVRHSDLGFVLFPANDNLWHKHIGLLILQCFSKGELVSAGFASIEEGKVFCYGESESLKMKSRKEDGELLSKQLGFS